jgi:hypothetical protein
LFFLLPDDPSRGRCCCGLRGSRGTISGRNVLKTPFSSKNGSDELSHFEDVEICAKKLNFDAFQQLPCGDDEDESARRISRA